MNTKLMSLLACPKCKGALSYHKRQAELRCAQDRLAFPVRGSIPVLLLSDARVLQADESA